MKWIKIFIYSAGGILLAAALIRFVIAARNSQILSLPEPLLGIPLWDAVLIMGGLELMVALVCLFGTSISLQVGLLAWLATNFIVFQIGLFWLHCQPQGTCLGSLTDPLHLPGGTMGYLFISLYFTLGSYVALGWLWLKSRTAQISANSFKMSCPACGVHIRFAIQNLGQKIPCPYCKTGITLRKPDNLKMSCFFCQEHIEFPAYAIGEKMPCPHCNMDITLKEPA